MGKTSKTIFFELSQAAGYCCPRKLLEVNDKVRARDAADKLGLHVRTFNLWRRAFRDGNLVPCARCSHSSRETTLTQS